MLDPEYAAHMTDRLTELWAELEDEILRDMARRIRAADYFTPAADWQMQKLIEAGLMRDEIVRKLAKMLGVTKKELVRMMQEAGAMSLRSDIAALGDKARLSYSDLIASPALIGILNAGYEQTLGEFTNLTRTTAGAASQQFIDAMDEVWMKVNSGAFSVSAACDAACIKLAKDGIHAVRYPTGHVDTIETAVRRAARTGVNQTAAKMSDQTAEELEIDLVVTTAHAGARPSHAVWQGKVFSRSGKSKKYPDLREGTGYGTGAGLCGWNCRHNFRVYVDGTPLPYSASRLREFNAKNREYNGKKMTEYEASQVQRYMERTVRSWKRREAVGDPAAGAKVKAWQDKLADFTDKTGLQRQYDREKIY